MERLVVLGASTGGVRAITALAAALPADFAAPLLVVLHIGAHRSTLPEILSMNCALEVAHARHDDVMRPGCIYIGPPDHHMLVAGDRIALSRGAKEHHTRPAIDPLFRSAALTHGAGVVGVVLSGHLDDGTAGLQAIKQYGGVAVVQDPAEALAPSMPQSAIDHVAVDHCIGLAALAPLLAALAAAPIGPARGPLDSAARREQALILGQGDPMENLRTIGRPSTLVCPDCHGSLWEVGDERPPRFRCHTGHGFTARTLQDTLAIAADEATWSALRALQERELLLDDMAERASADGDAIAAARLEAAASRLATQVSSLRQLLEAGPEPIE